MGNYFKWTFIWLFLLIIIVGGIIRFMGGLPLGMFVFVVGLVILFYFLNKEHTTKRKTEIVNILIDILKAEPVLKNVMKFKIETFYFYTEIIIDFKRGFQLANVEIINFHIPKDQFDRLSTKPEIVISENKINEIQTYIVYQTNGDGLKLAKKKLEEMILQAS